MLSVDHLGLWLYFVLTKFNHVLWFLCYICVWLLRYTRGWHLGHHGVKIRCRARFRLSRCGWGWRFWLGFHRIWRRPRGVWTDFLRVLRDKRRASSLCSISWGLFGFQLSALRFVNLTLFSCHDVPSRWTWSLFWSFEKLRWRFTLGQRAVLWWGWFICRRFSTPFFKFWSCCCFLFTWLRPRLCRWHSKCSLFCILWRLILRSSFGGHSSFPLHSSDPFIYRLSQVPILYRNRAVYPVLEVSRILGLAIRRCERRFLHHFFIISQV